MRPTGEPPRSFPDRSHVRAGGEGLDIGSIVGNVASGGVGGGILLAIVGFVKKAMAKG